MATKLTPQEAWHRVIDAISLNKRRAKGVSATPDVQEMGGVYVFLQGASATITTAYEELPTVIGQWEEGNGVMPDALTDMINSYAEQVTWWENADHTETKAKRAAKATTAKADIPHMVKAKWGQWTPFNDLCPTGCPTGCVITAVAQLMWYWRQYPRGCTALKAYKTATEKRKIAALPSIMVFDYDHMSDTKPTTAEGKKAVAQLMQYLGVACQADYKKNDTTALFSKAYHVLEDNIRLCTKMGYEYESLLGAEKFESKIYNSLKKGCPVIVCGGKVDGSVSHAFIIDGYNSKKGLYHCNWGWFGQYDGWFALNALKPSSAWQFSFNKIAITNIKPTTILGDINGDGEVAIQDVMEEVTNVLNGKNDAKNDVNYDGKVDANDVNTIANIILEGGKQ